MIRSIAGIFYTIKNNNRTKGKKRGLEKKVFEAREKLLRLEKQKQKEESWHKWYAWYPVKIEGTWIWRETVWRSRSAVGSTRGQWMYQSALTVSTWGNR